MPIGHPRATDRAIAQAGHMELAARITNFYDALVGAVDANDIDMGIWAYGRWRGGWGSLYPVGSIVWWADLRMRIIVDEERRRLAGLDS